MPNTLTKILLVEDDPDIQSIAAMALETMGNFNVHMASSGLQALELLSDGLHPQLILLDVMMPELDGISTFKKVRQLPGYEDQPIVFMTAKVQRQEVEHYMELGALGLISKPFDPMALADNVQELWNNRNMPKKA